MAVSLSIRVDGIPEVEAMLDRINPKKNSAWVGRALLKCALGVQKTAAEKKIRRGGKGPPVPRILTSRTGTLRRSIRVNRSLLPWAVEVGTDLVYGAVHEKGSKHHPPRPFLAPALEDESSDFDRIFSREWAKEMP